MISLVLILPQALADTGNVLAICLGLDVAPGCTYSVPLSSDGGTTITHRGCHTWASPTFIATLDAAALGQAPVPEGCTAQQAADVMAALIRSDRNDGSSPEAHFSAVLTANGLVVSYPE